MFQPLLQEFVEHTEGGVASVLMGFDGIAIDQYIRDSDAVNVETVAMEYGVILKQIREAAQMLEAGDTREVTIQAEHMCAVMRLLNEDYFVAVAIAPDGNLGKARYLLRLRASQLLDALS